jgi:hypothetical protein
MVIGDDGVGIMSHAAPSKARMPRGVHSSIERSALCTIRFTPYLAQTAVKRDVGHKRLAFLGQGAKSQQ